MLCVGQASKPVKKEHKVLYNQHCTCVVDIAMPCQSLGKHPYYIMLPGAKKGGK